MFFVMMAFLVSVLMSWVTIPRIVIISKIKRLFDTPDDRKSHTEAIPRLGGISFFPITMFSFSLMLGLRYYNGLEVPFAMEGVMLTEFFFMTAGMFMIFFVGLGDDLVGISYRYKFLVQITSAVTLAYAGLSFDNLYGLFGVHQIPEWLGAVITLIFTVFVVNAFNLLDGVDGLCSGISTIILSLLGCWYIYMELYVYAMLAFSMVGVVLVFFQYNVLGKRLKIFMGDTGSLTLGYAVVFLLLKFLKIETVADPDVYHINNSLAILIGLLFVPMFDTLRVALSRMTRGKSPFEPDQTHMHHKLLHMGFSHLQSTAILLVAEILFITLNIILSEVIGLNISIIVATDLVLGISLNFIMNSFAYYHYEPKSQRDANAGQAENADESK